MLPLATAVLTSATVSFVLMRLLLRSPILQHLQDIPCGRSLHTRPIPRSGGIAVIVGAAAVVQLSMWL